MMFFILFQAGPVINNRTFKNNGGLAITGQSLNHTPPKATYALIIQVHTVSCQTVGNQNAVVVFPAKNFWTTAILPQQNVILVYPVIVFSQVEPLEMRHACL
jgi:hypothetical protein